MQQLCYTTNNYLSLFCYLSCENFKPKLKLNPVILQRIITVSQNPYCASCILT